MTEKENVLNTTSLEAGRYFRHMADFVGFGEEEAKSVRATRYIIEKHIPAIVAKFYSH